MLLRALHSSIWLLSTLSLFAAAQPNHDHGPPGNSGSSRFIHAQANLVDLYSDAAAAEQHVTNLRGRSSRATGPDRESLALELARAIEYQEERHPAKDGRRKDALKEALRSYKRASNEAKRGGKIRYTGKVRELSVALGDRAGFESFFAAAIADSDVPDQQRYVAHVDYAAGKVAFNQGRLSAEAEDQFYAAMHLRSPENAYEAYFRYSTLLVDEDRAAEAVSLLDRFTPEQRYLNASLALLRQKAIHQSGGDTSEVDEELKQIRKAWSHAAGVGDVPKYVPSKVTSALPALSLPEVHAAFSHTNASDDSRGPNAGAFILSPMGFLYSATIVNLAEVMYNEARSEPKEAVITVAWAVRNRSLLSMNGCDFYPGAEGQGGTPACRAATPVGPQPSRADFVAAYRAHSCVMHGGTTTVGAQHEQMDDTHVDIASLEAAGLLGWATGVFNGWVPDRSSINTPSGIFFTGAWAIFQQPEVTSGNPAGAQEWRSINYCAARSHCKVRLGNVWGNLPDPGNPCPGSGPLTTDNFFWGRKP